MMTLLPFICLGIGIMLGLFIKRPGFLFASETVMTVALIILMLAIGIGVGMDESVMNNFLNIGLNCVVISLSAIFFSVIFMVVIEKTILPLGKLDAELKTKHMDLNSMNDNNSLEHVNSDPPEKSRSHLVWIMPTTVIAGLLIGIFFRSHLDERMIDGCFTVSLAILYISVGVSQGAHKEVFSFIRKLGFKILLIPIAVVIGSLLGGFLSGLLLGLPIHTSVLSAGGMSFYSITGAFMTETYGLEAGTYGFIVNIMREFFTVLLMPLLIRIGPGSPIVSGAAGDMDTMLAPITKFIGVRLGLVALITGIVLTFVVPVMLPVLSLLFS